MKTNQEELITRDWLAIERTNLANERTFLAYFRTSMVMLGAGIGIIRIDLFDPVFELGIALILISLLILPFGIWRLLRVKRRIKKFYKQDLCQ